VDARHYHVADGGEINIPNGDVELSDGLETATYYSLWGGNERDSGSDADLPQQWWGNCGELDPERIYRSQTQNLLRALPAVPANLRRIEDAALNDLAWMTNSLAKTVTVSARIPALNTIQIDVQIDINGQVFPLSFSSGWQRK
jgi:phage gp46-like protein